MALTVSEEIISIKIEGLDEVQQGYREVIRSQGKLEDSTGSTDNAVKRSSEGFSKLEKRLVSLGSATQIAQAGVLALQKAIGALSSPVQLASNFERDFSKITTLLNDTGDGFGSLREKFLELNRRVPQDIADVLKAGYDAASSGFNESDIIPFLEQASAAGVAGGTSMTEAVSILTSAVSAYSEAGVDAAQVSDVFFATVRGGKTTMEELSASFGRGAALASMGVSIEELGAAIAALTLKGIPTAEAMTSINAAVKALSSESGAAVGALRDMGAEAGVSTMTGKGFAFALNEVLDATGGTAEGLSRLKLDMEAQKALTLLLSDGMDGFNARLEDNQKAAGATADANRKMAATADQAFKMFGKLRDDVLMEIGMRLLPDVNRLLERLTQIIQENGSKATDVAVQFGRAFIEFGEFVIDNGPKIVKTFERVFSVLAVSKFIQSVKTARGEIVKLGVSSANSFGSNLAAMLRSPNVATLAVSAAVALGGLIGDTIGDAMTQSVKRQQERLDAQVAADLAKTQAKLAAAGFSGEADKRGVEARLRSGSLLAAPELINQTAEGDIDFEGAKAEAMTAAAAIKEFGKESAQEMADRMGDAFEDAADRLEGMVQHQRSTIRDLEKDAEGFRAAGADDLEQKRLAEIEAASDRLEELIELRASRLKAASDVRASVGLAETMASGQTTRGATSAGAPKADLVKAAEQRLQLEEQLEIQRLKVLGNHEAAEIKQLEARQRKQLDAIKKAGAEALTIEDTHQRQRVALRTKYEEEAAAGVFAALDETLEAEAEAQRIEDEARERRGQAQEAERMQAQQNRQRVLEMRGEHQAADLLALQMEQALEMEMHQGNADAKLAIEQHYADRRSEIMQAANRKQINEIRQYGEAAGGAMMGILGAVSNLSNARMRSAKIDLEAGKISRKAYESQAKAAFEFERKQIIAKGVMSGFMGIVDAAMSLSHFAGGNPVQGAAFAASSVKHLANAAIAPEMANHAFGANMAGLQSGGGRSGGGGGASPAMSGGGISTAQPRDLEGREQAPTIQFGDIVLSDVPGLLSDEGVRQLGARVAGSVADEINRQAGIPGGFRMEG